jgi:hypothetical protein
LHCAYSSKEIPCFEVKVSIIVILLHGGITDINVFCKISNHLHDYKFNIGQGFFYHLHVTSEFCGEAVTGHIPGFNFVPQFVFMGEEQGDCADVYQVVHRYFNKQVTEK